ncbi:MAG: succinate dehydrogenase, cytochrome b556 subunit [Anaerolineae bacterium]|nr:succinate dehydrogenase, cytochrome b556 subunit [Anaerolineae bacterium]
MTTLVLTITETLRYRGKLGQWSWALHRLAGLGVLFFFILHVIDTSWSVFYPELYAEAIAVYQSPLFTLGEFALVAAVVYHGINGLRIVVFDYRPQWWKYQEKGALIVLAVSAVILIPTFLLMGYHVMRFYQEPTTVFDLQIMRVVNSQLPFLIGIAATFVGGIILAGLWSVVDRPGAKKQYKRSSFDTFMWTFMRISGILIVPLAFGHLAMVHVIQGVFDITKAGFVPVGSIDANVTGFAADFVTIRWNTMFAGVLIWRIYDAALLAFVAIHAFNGLRYVVNDYIHNKIINRGAQIAILVGCVILITVGSAAIISTSPRTTAEMLESSQVITDQPVN